MGWDNPPIPWSELERKLSGRRPAGVRPGDGGDSPAWSRRRADYVATPAPDRRSRTWCPTPSCTATPTSASSTAPATRRSWPRRRPGWGSTALALTDHDGFYGVVRFAEAARELRRAHDLRRGAVARAARAAGRRRRPGGRSTCSCWPAARRATAGSAARSARPSSAAARRAARSTTRTSWPARTTATGWCSPAAARARSRPRWPAGGAAGTDAARGELDELVGLFGRDNVAVELIAPRRPARRRPQRRAGRAGRRPRAAHGRHQQRALRRARPAPAGHRAGRGPGPAQPGRDGRLAARRRHRPPALRRGDGGPVRRLPGRGGRGPPSSAWSCAFDLHLVAPQLPDYPCRPGTPR